VAVNRRKVLVTALVGLVSGLAVGAVLGWALAPDPGDDSTSVDAVLDEPGEYQTPGIGTNAPVQGTPFPDVALTDLDGFDTTTGAFLGQPLVVNAWFSTCQPCKRELPAFAEVAADYAGQVAFLGINPNDTTETATAFLQDYAITYPTLLDPNGTFLTEAGIATFPSTLFVAADGTIVRQKAGEITEDELREIIETQLLGAPGGGG
jgi:thiol-disulfide isomerase/thioredoxin